MDREETRELLVKLTGSQLATLNPPENFDLFANSNASLGYSQLNELLLLFGFDRITHTFFRYLLDGGTDYEAGQEFVSPEQLLDGVARFRELAILLYGNVKFAFKSLSRDSKLLVQELDSATTIPDEVFSSRHNPILPVSTILPHDAYLTGYLIEQKLKAKLESNPDDAEAVALESRRLEVVELATRNQIAYLASDHLDVYIATSMREQHDFLAISRLAMQIFTDPVIAPLKLRWFDPTQAYCPDRIDKGLSEALMLRRATCTIYLAQESDTLGKDSELASTLAQGKPVVAFIPEVTEEYVDAHLETLRETHVESSPTSLMLEQLRIFDPNAAWSDVEVRKWCEAPDDVNAVALRSHLQDRMKVHYDYRARTLRESHPLGIQVNLQTGVANGVLVVRSVPDCARLVRNIVTHRLEFNLEEDDKFIVLRERISGCIFRVVTRDEMLTNTFWNFYIDPAE